MNRGRVALVGAAAVLLLSVPAVANWADGLVGYVTSHAAVLLLAWLAFREAKDDGARPGSWALFAGCALWAVAGSTWFLLTLVLGIPITWHSYAYPVAALCFAYAADRMVAGEPIPGGRVARARVCIDVVIVTVAALLVWWLLSGGAPFAPAESAMIVGQTAADAVFLVVAVTASARSRADTRRVGGLLAAGAAFLMAADLLVAVVPTLDAYAHNPFVVVLWFWFLICLLLVPVDRRRPAATGRSVRPARWILVTFVPTTALLALVAVELFGDRAYSKLLTAVKLVLILALTVRELLHVRECRLLEIGLRRSTASLSRAADHDVLTGLLGRAAFLRGAADAVAGRHHDGATLAILWIDIDSFTRINDTLGHDVGDEVLRSVADRLRAGAAGGDLVARIGADEFAVLRPHLTEPTDRWAARVRTALGMPITARGVSVEVTSSIGVVESTREYEDVTQLLIDCDLALYQAKRAGQNHVEHYTAGLRASQRERTRLAVHIRRMIDEGEVDIRYQPIVELATGATVGAEALTRLPGPDGRALSPAEYLPHLETLGLLARLGAIVVARACADFAGAPRLGFVSVNVTADDLADPGFGERLRAELAGSGLPPERLVIEIPERVATESYAAEVTRAIRALGVGIALDGFGAGWSSLAQLRGLALDSVKIDRGVVAAGNSGEGRIAAMLVATVAMARSLGLAVVAVGIERPADAVAAESAGATLGQGHLWSPAKDLGTLMGQPPPGTASSAAS